MKDNDNDKDMTPPDANLLGPKDHADAVALFRAQMIGALAHRRFESHGQLKRQLRELSARRRDALLADAQRRTVADVRVPERASTSC